MPPRQAWRIQFAAPSPGPGRQSQLQRLPQPAYGPGGERRGNLAGHGKGHLRTVPRGAAGPFCLRTRGRSRGLHHVPCGARFNQCQIADPAKSNPLFEMPYAATDGSRKHCHRRSRPHPICLEGNLLERRLSRGCPWLSGRFVASILAHEENSRERNFEIGPAFCRTDQR